MSEGYLIAMRKVSDCSCGCDTCGTIGVWLVCAIIADALSVKVDVGRGARRGRGGRRVQGDEERGAEEEVAPVQGGGHLFWVVWQEDGDWCTMWYWCIDALVHNCQLTRGVDHKKASSS